jgi:OmcA/MtrC family decaheme c-type cytochrome
MRCHDDLQFHGGNQRGYETCMGCHGASGAEDRPRYVAGNAPATPGLSIEFRTMLHKIHHGKELAAGSSYQIIGFGSSAQPDNFTAHTYDKAGFPDLPGGTSNCAACHGAGNSAYQNPPDRTHPLGQPKPSRVWRDACMTCHDSVSTKAHVDANSSPLGYESCSICHGPGQDWNVGRMHKVR